MPEKAKKGKGRIKQWQFALAWIGGQFGMLGVLAIMGVVSVSLVDSVVGLVGYSFETIPMFLQSGVAGAAIGWLNGWVQQWSIRKRFGHNIKGWRGLSAVLTGVVFMVVIPLVRWLAWNTSIITQDNETLSITLFYMAIFGAAGLGQALLLRKHIKHSWLYFMSTLVGAIMFALPSIGDTPFILAQIAQYSVTAFTIIWLFGMSGTGDALVSADTAVDRLTDADTEDDDLYEYDNATAKRRKRLQWVRFWRRFGFGV